MARTEEQVRFFGRASSRDTILHKVKDKTCYESGIISPEYQVAKSNWNQGRRR